MGDTGGPQAGHFIAPAQGGLFGSTRRIGLSSDPAIVQKRGEGGADRVGWKGDPLTDGAIAGKAVMRSAWLGGTIGLLAILLPRAAADEQAVLQTLSKLGATFERDEQQPGKPVVRAELEPGRARVGDTEVRQLTQLKEIESLNLRNTAVTDEGLKALAALSKLRRLDLRGTAVTDAGVKVLARFSSVRRLNLTNTAVTGAALKDLKRLTQLRWLSLEGTKIDDESLQEMTAMKELAWLNVSCTALTDAGLAELCRLPDLQSLNISHTRISDAGLGPLKQLAHLRALNLAATQVTDAGLSALRELPSLETLYLYWTKVSDGGVPELRDMTNLKELHIGLAEVTDNGFRELKQALPGCAVLGMPITGRARPAHEDGAADLAHVGKFAVLGLAILLLGILWMRRAGSGRRPGTSCGPTPFR